MPNELLGVNWKAICSTLANPNKTEGSPHPSTPYAVEVTCDAFEKHSRKFGHKKNLGLGKCVISVTQRPETKQHPSSLRLFTLFPHQSHDCSLDEPKFPPLFFHIPCFKSRTSFFFFKPSSGRSSYGKGTRNGTEYQVCDLVSRLITFRRTSW